MRADPGSHGRIRPVAVSGRRALRLEADGGSRGNPGVAGYGAVVFDAVTGDTLAERAAPLGKASNNVAEYSGLIAGLEAAMEIDPGARIEVAMDSKLVIEQMAGRWKIKHEDMRRLALQAQDLVRRIRESEGEVTWTWIPRERNKRADKLSNDGMDGEVVTSDYWREADSRPASLAGEQLTLLMPDEDGERAVPEPPVVVPARTSPTPRRIVLLRHGVTDLTVQGRLDGRGGIDPELNPEGRRQAYAAAQGVHDQILGEVPYVVTSSLARAKATGGAVAQALGVPARVDADWDEQSFGAWDGLSFSRIRDLAPDGLASLRSDPDFCAPGGESHRDFIARVLAAYERLLDGVDEGQTVVVATHRKPIMAVLAHVLGLDMASGWRLGCGPASFTVVDVFPGAVTIERLNDQHHL
ncbi:bifunctional RNase H/acid phosphatase [Branchiibius cervicis]|uniref:Bifunctional RNase H/acid phosphatase n=1 Tax=Branchiibius cervicis TaxID=908252 RepID=A0ABW2AUD0_9MICO